MSFDESIPGVRLEEALSALSESEIKSLLPSGLLPALRVLSGDSRGDDEPIHKTVAEVLDLEQVLNKPENRKLLVSILPDQKKQELSARVGIPSDELTTASYDADELRALVGFFGGVVEGKVASESLPRFKQLQPDYGLFGYQRQACREVEVYLADEFTVLPSVLLHMPTGSGKTRTAMHSICSFLCDNEPSTILWLANSSELLEQASAEFERAWGGLGNRKLRVVHFWGDIETLEECDDGIVVGGLQKLHALSRRDVQRVHRLALRLDFVVVDEAHISVADTYNDLISIFRRNPDTRLLGLSATPGRTWNDPSEDSRLAKLYDRNKVTIQIEGYESPVNYLIEEGYLAEPTFKMLDLQGEALEEKFTDKGAMEQEGDDLSDTLSVSQRTAYLVAVVRQVLVLAERHQRILVFAASVENAKTVALLLRREGVGADVITGETPTAIRAGIIRRYRQAGGEPRVIVNFGVLTAGFDAPGTSAAVIARPTRSLVLYSQMVGRAIRGPKAGGNETAEIVTVVDPKLPGFGSVASAFQNWEDVW